MIASSLLNEGYLQPAGDLSKNAVDGTAENPFLDNPDAFYYFVSERSYLATLPVMETALCRFKAGPPTCVKERPSPLPRVFSCS